MKVSCSLIIFHYIFCCVVPQEKIEVVNAQADLFAEADHFDAPSIKEKKEVLNSRYQQLQVIMIMKCV